MFDVIKEILKSEKKFTVIKLNDCKKLWFT